MSGKQGLFTYFSGRRPGGRAQRRLIGRRYELLSELGRGGMGTVWLGDDKFLHRQVAVKELRAPGKVAGADLREQQSRAIREAQSAARIKHSNAVTLFDATIEGDAVYLIMELVEGVTLKELIDRDGPLAASAVAGYGLQLLDVLAAAHALGIVHRDVKPGNVMITSAGQVKLSDFGLAHTVGDPRLTSANVVMGTQAYLAPELFENAPITPAADLWSLGATLYDAAVGRGPFDRETIAATLRAIVVDDLPVPRCDPALAAAITALLRRNPQERATVERAQRLLRRAAEQLPAADPVSPPAGPAPRSATDAATGPGTVPSGSWQRVPSPGPGRGWDPDADTGRQLPPPTAGISRSVPPVKPRRAHRFRGGCGALATAVVVIVAAVILLGHHGNDGPGTTTPPPSVSATATKPKPKPTLPPPTAPSGTLRDGESTLGVTAVAFSSDGNLIATGDGNGTTYLWDPANHQPVGSVDDADYCQQDTDDPKPCDDSTTRGVDSLAMNGAVLATADQNGFIYRWSTASATLGQPVPSLLQDPATVGGVLAITYDSTGQNMATGDGDGNAYLWTGGDVDLPPLPDQNSPKQPVTAVAFSPDGTVLAAGDGTGTTNLWSSLDSSPGNSPPNESLPDPQGAQITSLAFGGPGGALLAVGDADGNVCLYHWQTTDTTGTCFWSDPDGDGVTAIAFSANGAVLAIGDSNGGVYLDSFANSAAPKSLLKHPFSNPDAQGDDTYLPNLKGVSSLAFNPASPVGTLAVGDADGNTYLWPMNWLP
jgi:WD40 repeat protein/tRNA A-37 threonylcarbamoyl transferase component Bud32